MATVAKSTRSTSITLGSGTAGPFSVGFRLFNDDALDVFVNGTRSADWTLSSTYADGYDDAATITFGTALETADVVVIESNLTPGRADDYVASDPSLTTKLNTELGRLWSSVSDLHRGVSRSIRGFDAIEPASGIDLTTIVEAETFADRAEAAQVASEAAQTAAEAAQTAAEAAENSLLEWKRAWLTDTDYAPSNIVSEAGASYICVSAHTSGTFSTDIGNGLWDVLAAKGTAGAGTGDMLGANNLADVASAAASRSSLGLIIGTHVQAQNADLQSIADLSPSDGETIVYDTGAWTLAALAGVSGDYQAFTSSGTWTKPAGATIVRVQAWGAGGGGGDGGGSQAGGGGGGGAYAEAWFLASDLAATVAVTVGAAGTGGQPGGIASTNGGNSTFGAHLTAYGGGRGENSAERQGGGGGELAAGDVATGGKIGGASAGDAETIWGGGAGAIGTGIPGGSGVYGAGGGGSKSNGAGGTSKFAGAGGQGAPGVAGGDGLDGVAPGGGGGGSQINGDGGNGARGEVRVWVF